MSFDNSTCRVDLYSFYHTKPKGLFSLLTIPFPPPKKPTQDPLRRFRMSGHITGILRYTKTHRLVNSENLEPNSPHKTTQNAPKIDEESSNWTNQRRATVLMHVCRALIVCFNSLINKTIRSLRNICL